MHILKVTDLSFLKESFISFWGGLTYLRFSKMCLFPSFFPNSRQLGYKQVSYFLISFTKFKYTKVFFLVESCKLVDRIQNKWLFLNTPSFSLFANFCLWFRNFKNTHISWASNSTVMWNMSKKKQKCLKIVDALTLLISSLSKHQVIYQGYYSLTNHLLFYYCFFSFFIEQDIFYKLQLFLTDIK